MSSAFHINGKWLRASIPSYVTSQTSQVFVGSRNSVVYEQIFLDGRDPNPETEDWFSFITGFNPSHVSAFKMSASATSVGAHGSISPICRATLPIDAVDPRDWYIQPGLTIPRSAMLYADGVNNGFEWTQFSSVDTLSMYSAETTGWVDIHAICGNASTSNIEMSAAVSVYNPFFGGTRAQWETGGPSMPFSASFCGAVQFIYTGVVPAVTSNYLFGN